jgi:hypothetical protein
MENIEVPIIVFFLSVVVVFLLYHLAKFGCRVFGMYKYLVRFTDVRYRLYGKDCEDDFIDLNSKLAEFSCEVHVIKDKLKLLEGVYTTKKAKGKGKN